MCNLKKNPCVQYCLKCIHILFLYCSTQAANKDASQHIIASTFPFAATYEEIINAGCTIRETKPFQERKMESNLHKIERSEAKLNKQWNDYKSTMKQSGLFCCPKKCSQTQSRCLCIFSSEAMLNRHQTNGKCKFPPVDLSTNLHLLHLNGKIAFSLATGTMTNKASAANMKPLHVQDGNPDLTPAIWFSRGCYNSVRKKGTRASKALQSDLEHLFLAGHQVNNKDKGAANKYTPLQALTYLKNLTLENGRRKYSDDPLNVNGPLPTIQYIKSWFGRRARKMLHEDSDHDDSFYDDITDHDLNEMSEDKLKSIVKKSLSLPRITEKTLLIKLLPMLCDLNGDIGTSSEHKALKELRLECLSYGISSNGRVNKELLVASIQVKREHNQMKNNNGLFELSLENAEEE